VLSGRGLCIGLITRPEESYRMCSVSECDREASTMRKPRPTRGCRTMGEGGNVEQSNEALKCVTTCINYVITFVFLSNTFMLPPCEV
jgi:hypothetical protein